MEKKIEIYSEDRFEKELNVLKKIFGDSIFLLNGAAIFCYTKDFDLPERLPTDIDIGTNKPLTEVNKILNQSSIKNFIDANPFKAWGFEYSEPCVRAEINGSEITILNKSTIKSNNGRIFSIDFNDSNIFETRFSKRYDVRIASLEYLDLVKDFQSRSAPKLDLSDKNIISKLVSLNPGLFNSTKHYRMIDSIISKESNWKEN